MAKKKNVLPAPRFRDRIKYLTRVKASELLDNPKNWRKHPEEQAGAMRSMLEKLGFTGAAVARETDKGLQLIDGHLRKDIAGEDMVPVLVVDLNEQEADLMLATFDPLSDLAVMDAQALRGLLEGTGQVDDDAFLRQLMAEVDGDLAQTASKQTKEREVEGMALEPHEHYDYVIVLAQTAHEFNVLCQRLGLAPEQRHKTMGTARAIRATKLLEKLNASS